MNVWGNERGAAMLVALGILMMMSLIGAAVVQTSSTDVGIANNSRCDLRSFYIAEAGVEHAYGCLRDSSDWREGFTDEPFTSGFYTVIVGDSNVNPALDDTVVLVSAGVFLNAVSTIEVKLAPLRPFQWAAFARDSLRVCGDTYTDSYNSDSGTYAATVVQDDGDVGSNGDIVLCGQADINGDASTAEAGALSIEGFADVSGDTTTEAPVVIFDPVPQSAIDFAIAASMAPAGLSGSFNYNNGTKDLRVLPGNIMTMVSGTYYFNDIDVNGTINLAPGAQVEIYIGGDVNIMSGARINIGGVPADMIIYGIGSTIRFSAGSQISAVIYAPETDIILNGGSEIFGAFVGNVADDIGGSGFHYDQALRDLELGNLYQKVCWREL